MFDPSRLCALLLSSITAVMVALFLAPDGYEDEHGFHVVPKARKVPEPFGPTSRAV